ncbi:MAG: hypothetical protein NTZ35_02560 [Ignavibacteriales bacterium]|nr:hypothetical protein [Ignavibacteriales bacterium]
MQITIPTIIKEKISGNTKLKWWEESFERALEVPDDKIVVAALVNCDVFMEKVWIPSGDGKYSRAYEPLRDKDGQLYIKREPFLKQGDGYDPDREDARASKLDASNMYRRYEDNYYDRDETAGRFENKRCLVLYYYFHSSPETINSANVKYTTPSRGIDLDAAEEIWYEEDYRLVRDTIYCCSKVAGYYDLNDVPFYFTDKAGKECYDEQTISDQCYDCRPSILGEKLEKQR